MGAARPQRPPVSDEAIVAALRATGGRLRAAGQKVALTGEGVRQRIKRSPRLGAALARIKHEAYLARCFACGHEIRLRRGRRMRSYQLLAEVPSLRAYRAHIQAVVRAETLARTPPWTAADLSPPNPRRKIEDAAICAAYRETLGNLRQAAASLGVEICGITRREKVFPRLRAYRERVRQVAASHVVPLALLPKWRPDWTPPEAIPPPAGPDAVR